MPPNIDVTHQPPERNQVNSFHHHQNSTNQSNERLLKDLLEKLTARSMAVALAELDMSGGKKSITRILVTNALKAAETRLVFGESLLEDAEKKLEAARFSVTVALRDLGLSRERVDFDRTKVNALRKALNSFDI